MYDKFKSFGCKPVVDDHIIKIDINTGISEKRIDDIAGRISSTWN